MIFFYFSGLVSCIFFGLPAFDFLSLVQSGGIALHSSTFCIVLSSKLNCLQLNWCLFQSRPPAIFHPSDYWLHFLNGLQISHLLF